MPNIIDTYGKNAGKVWKTLEKCGPCNETTLRKKTQLNKEDFYTAIGWLAKENKIWIDNDSYNIGNNNPVRLIDFIEILENKLGKKTKKNFMPMQAGDVPSTYADVDDLVKDFDYKPKTRIEDGVSKFVDWYLEYYNKQQLY